MPAVAEDTQQKLAGMSSESVARLKELAGLRDQGILTDQEFEEQKRGLLGGGK